ncbi:MAG: Trm112 family protein [Leptospirillia bacterium]
MNMPLDDALRAVLVCPQCKGELRDETGPEALVCDVCRLRYLVEDGIPVMLVDEAEQL